MKNDVLSKLHTAELSMLIEIDRICRKHNLTYFLTCGTLLGAVRHKGFIPWDEDLDVSMPREDYDRFVRIAQDEIQDRFIVDCHFNNEFYFNPFAKIRLKNSAFEIKALKNYKGHQGIWLDIFPMDYINDSTSKSLARREKIINLCRTMICSHRNILNWNEVGGSKKAIYKVISLLPDRLFWWLMYKMHTCSDRQKNNVVMFGTDYSYDRLIFPMSDFIPATEVEFEGHKFFAPAKYDNVLTKIYGDYMKIPPQSEQVTFFPMKIVFEDGEEVEFEDNKE